MALNWQRNDYFSMLMSKDKRAHAALEMLVDDLHTDKERSITRFLTHSGSEDFLWGLIKLLGNANPRVAGNAAYILGTVAESELGCIRVIGLTESKHPDSRRILPDLTGMLCFDDAESVMNAAGTMGTLAESVEGRTWMLSEACIQDTIQNVTELLTNENMWTASNAALVLARLTIAEEGCERILEHIKWRYILCQLVSALGVDEAGRGMNAAFAIGRLCDMERGRTRLLSLDESEKMISSLAKMLVCSDPGASKNACFALSCLATSLEGHNRLLRNTHASEVLSTLAALLANTDSETGWFAAMTLRTLAGQPSGCVRLREHPNVLTALHAIESRDDVNCDLKEEVMQTLEILKFLDKPQPPNVTVTGATSVDVEWEEVTTRSGFPIRYNLHEGSRCVYSGKERSCTVDNLKAFTEYSFRVRAVTDGEDGALSEPSTITTLEDVPGPPLNLRLLGFTTTQLKVGWEPPDNPNGVLKGYYVYVGDKNPEHTHELSAIVSGLQPGTEYAVSVCTATSKGKGPKDTIAATTAEMGAHAPSKPEVTVLGRSEMNVSWRAPEVPLGRITRYDVHMNGLVIHSSTDLHCVAQRLKSDTEYKFSVTAITGEGKYESKPTKKRTAKDEFEGERAPLYQTPKRDDSEPKVSNKKRKSVTMETAPKTRSASAASAKAPPPAKLSALRRVKSAKSGSESPVQTVYKLTYTNRKHRQKENNKSTASLGSTPATTEPEAVIVKATSSSSSVPHPPKHKAPEPPVAAPEKKAEVKEGPSPASNKPAATVEDLGGHLTGKPVPPFNTPAASEADYSKYQRTNTPDITTSTTSKPSLPKPKPPTTRNKQNQQRHSNNNANSTNTDNGESSNNNQIVRHHKQGNDILTVEIADRKEKRLQKDGGAYGDSGAGRLRRRSLKNSLSASSSSHQEHEGGEDNKAPHNHFSGHSKRYDAGDITRTFSTLNMHGGSSNYHASSLTRQTTSITAFDPPIPMPSSSNNPQAIPSFQRANTFIAQFNSKSLGSNSNGGRSQQPRVSPATRASSGAVLPMGYNSNTHSSSQWQPDFPAAQKPKNHNKFVPMQFRTQPVNLPGQLVRQRTTIAGAGGGGAQGVDLQPEVLSGRGRTNIGGFGQGLLNPQDVAADISHMSHGDVAPSRHHHHQQQSTGAGGAAAGENSTVLTTVLAMGGGNSHHRSSPPSGGDHTMQSAR